MKCNLRSIEKYFIAVILFAAAFLFTGADAFAAEDGDAIDYSQVAGSGDMASVEEVELEGMFPVYADDIEDGVYDITVKSSSSMFKIEKAVLTVANGKMEAVMTMSGKGYLKLFMGTGKEAAAADPLDYIDFIEDENGKHTFTVPVEALDKAVACTAFSKNKHKWYDRSLLFEAKSLPAESVKAELPDYEKLEQAAMDKRIDAMRAENDASDVKEKDAGINVIYICAAIAAAAVIAVIIIVIRRKKK